MEIQTRNVNTAFYRLVRSIESRDVPLLRRLSRVGEVLQIAEPVSITYTHPRERVLLFADRDANPFFHLYEALWMLAGRNDVAPLTYYNARMKEFSDDGETFWGAYGHRWRRHFGYDQLDDIVEELRRNPNSRRCVLQMWDAARVHCRPGGGDKDWDLRRASIGGVDVPCNTQAYFSLRKDPQTEGEVAEQGENDWQLDMTVCNRSNDMIWGALGANVVHFSILQEYLAARIGVEVGRYTQFTNNLHVYTERWEPTKWLRQAPNEYKEAPVPLVEDPEVFERELPEFVERHSSSKFARVDYSEPFLLTVAQPMCVAFHWHKAREYRSAQSVMGAVEDRAWRTAGRAWLQKRQSNWEKKR